MPHEHTNVCRYCDGCKRCLYEVGFKQDEEATAEGHPFFICLNCGTSNWWD